jgi:bifunctional non-homologous end joining protein LigD
MLAVPLPPKIDPIIPLRTNAIPRGREWVYEAKLDGFRGVLFIEGGRGRFLSKTGKPMPRFRALADELARSMAVEEAIFDGEIVVLAEGGRPAFYPLLFAAGQPSYAAFDLLWLDGEDLRALPHHRRKALLKKVTRRGPIGFVEAVRDPALFDVVVEMDLEGIVAKRRGDPYAPDTEWLKIRHLGYSQKVGRAELFHRRRSGRPSSPSGRR